MLQNELPSPGELARLLLAVPGAHGVAGEGAQVRGDDADGVAGPPAGGVVVNEITSKGQVQLQGLGVVSTGHEVLRFRGLLGEEYV